MLIEELAARAWPAAEAHRADGWLLRHTPALTRRRSNSALPLDDPDVLDPAVVEAFYARRGGRPLVQVAPVEHHARLDERLARCGWSVEGATDVLVAAVDDVLACMRPGAVALSRRADADWVAAWAACEGRADAAQHRHEVLARIQPPAAYALARDRAGVGLCVCERGWAGLFSIATARHARRRGVAQAIVHALAHWAAQRGARRVYLQVEVDNAPAHALYARAGFTRSHSYHYRLAPG
jgi:ribosomal protein S18 acetylase RimI-like enzyme